MPFGVVGREGKRNVALDRRSDTPTARGNFGGMVWRNATYRENVPCSDAACSQIFLGNGVAIISHVHQASYAKDNLAGLKSCFFV